jgi:hypothetical protein
MLAYVKDQSIGQHLEFFIEKSMLLFFPAPMPSPPGGVEIYSRYFPSRQSRITIPNRRDIPLQQRRKEKGERRIK